VDDVANTGKTFFYAFKPLLEFTPKKVRVAVLVDRKHKAFPVSVDYVGLSLATTMHEHINVIIEESEKEGVYLS
jgi:pyrimidine operon attenuation protein/uracil phosphoribosyltransferase